MQNRLLHKLANGAGRRFAGTITHVVTEKPVVALTFDDGPHPVYTPRFLDLLSRFEAHGTFFMVGKLAANNPDLVSRVAAEGHQIGNHSWDHTPFSFLSGKERRQQLRSCERVLAPFGSKYFRPPNGDQDLRSRLDALWLGYNVVTWNLTVNDWKGRSGLEMAAELLDKIKPGSIILLHDGLYTTLDERFIDRGPTLQALEIVLDKLRGKYRFDTVSKLIETGVAGKKYWVRHVDRSILNNLKTVDP